MAYTMILSPTRLIINKSLVEVIGIDSKVVHYMLFKSLHIMGKYARKNIMPL